MEPLKLVVHMTRSELIADVRRVVRDELEEERKERRAHRPHPRSVTIADAALEIGCCTAKVRRLVKTKQLSATKVGKKMMVGRESLDQLLRESVR